MLLYIGINSKWTISKIFPGFVELSPLYYSVHDFLPSMILHMARKNLLVFEKKNKETKRKKKLIKIKKINIRNKNEKNNNKGFKNWKKRIDFNFPLFKVFWRNLFHGCPSLYLCIHLFNENQEDRNYNEWMLSINLWTKTDQVNKLNTI